MCRKCSEYLLLLLGSNIELDVHTELPFPKDTLRTFPTQIIFTMDFIGLHIVLNNNSCLFQLSKFSARIG